MSNEIARFIEIHNQIADRYYLNGQREAISWKNDNEKIKMLIEIAKSEQDDMTACSKIRELVVYWVFGE